MTTKKKYDPSRKEETEISLAVIESVGPIKRKQSEEVKKQRSEHLKKVRAARKSMPSGIPPKLPFETVFRKKRMLQNFIEQDFKDLSGAAMKAGFAASTAKSNLAQITSSRSWAAIVNEFLPDNLIAERHLELLNKRDIERYTEYERDENGKQRAVTKWRDNGPETAAVSKALDMAYKLKNSYKDNSADAPNTSVYNLIYKPEIRANLKTFEDQLKLAMYAENNKETTRDVIDIVNIPTEQRFTGPNERPFVGDDENTEGSGEGTDE